ncbi:MAG: response regulator [Oscillospiraceae bacterium]|nr:response regulator [Oscillospiraceae bacterium]MBP1554041.1 response regulator [Oscillospiraceae bacterium]
MRIYIVEDDISIISILEDIIETHNLGEICGDCGGEVANISDILRCKPDVVLVDFFMPVMDGVEVVNEIRKLNSSIKFIMISQVSSKELIGKAYTAGINFFIQKPINLIEVKTVLGNLNTQLENEKMLENIRKMFVTNVPLQIEPAIEDEYSKKIRMILSHIGMSGEKGCGDIIAICEYLHSNKIPVSQISVSQMCEAVSPSPKNMEQRVRRAIAAGMNNIAHMGIEDFMNETFMRYSSTLFSFEDVRSEMDHIRGKSPYGGKISIKKFIDGLMLEADRY